MDGGGERDEREKMKKESKKREPKRKRRINFNDLHINQMEPTITYTNSIQSENIPQGLCFI